ncbi:MAG: hypothetical protein ACTSPB_08450 [Candidatus Thorarchaeota archaeon]
METLFISYVILNIVVALAVVAHHDYTQWKNKPYPRNEGCAMIMPWLPLTVGYDNSTAPGWGKNYPPAVNLKDDFYDALHSGVVTLYYYNCGVRQEKKVTANYRFRSDEVSFTTFEDSNGKRTTGAGYLTEDNRVNAGEAKFKSICGWTAEGIANPDLKSEVAAEWRKDMV